ncbi:DNA polymerase III subunit delta' [Neptunicella marina]|uniref:DNA-directed DNA polymerase n=1 Tax=Neptunicella marina TaxID=2125989 RepID=A0A8J6M8M6_9ALTE|nr:DNA polymerase III subunit delta' [Neptunicella marina]MBC3767841.1 DNA polymerase III subunit delta' [Neptunicella marina]
MYPWLTSSFNALTVRAIDKKLHHGLILQGIEGIGKAEFADEFALFLLCQQKTAQGACGQCQSCKLNAAGSHPDLFKVEKEKSQIAVDQIREAIGALNKTAQLGGSKVLIVFGADDMNVASSNALLKTLEEPTLDTTILLVTDQPQRLLPTILSRCEKVPLHAPAETDAIDWLQQQGLQDNLLQTLQICAGAPLKAKMLLEAPDNLQYDDFCQQIQRLSKGEVSGLQLANQWQNDAESVVNWLQFWLKQNSTQPQSSMLWQAAQQCIAVKAQLQHTGINKSNLLFSVLERIKPLVTHF